MQLESAKYLEDIRQAGQTVLEASAGRTLDDYLGDKLLRLAVERCFEIMGEALHQLDQRDHETASRITDFKRIIGFRKPRSRRSLARPQLMIRNMGSDASKAFSIRQEPAVEVDESSALQDLLSAAKRAVRAALREHKLAGNPVAVWQDGKVVLVPPEEIEA